MTDQDQESAATCPRCKTRGTLGCSTHREPLIEEAWDRAAPAGRDVTHDILYECQECQQVVTGRSWQDHQRRHVIAAISPTQIWP